MGRGNVAAVCALTAAALALRLANIDQSLFQDEYWTYGVVTRHGFFHVASTVAHNNEITPPLPFLLSWLAAQLGDPKLWIRVPSLLLGTATVPVIYMLGKRVAGNTAGLIAAGIMALSPFAIFYSTEARGYAAMVFLVTLSTLALLHALEGGRRAWWVVYGVAVCLALYTHYTAVFVLAAQAIWAFWTHRQQLRTLVIVHVAIVIGYLPWLPGFLEQRGKTNNIESIGAIGLNKVGGDLDPHHVNAVGVLKSVARLLPGHPFLELDTLPGRLSVALLLIAVAATAVALFLRPGNRTSPRWSPDQQTVLILILAVITPVGLLLYAAVGEDLYTPRNLSASIPALAVVVSAFLAAGGPRLVAVTASLVLLGFGIGAVKTLDRDNERPAFREVAQYLDDTTRPDDLLVDQSRSELLGGPQSKNLVPLHVYLKHAPRVLTANEDDAPAWEHAARGGRVFFVRLDAGLFRGLPPLAGPDQRVVLREKRVFRGLVRILVGRYQGQVAGSLERRNGHEVISWSLGKGIVVGTTGVRGLAEGAAATGKRVVTNGWALTRSGEPVDWLLLFAGDRLMGATYPRLPRPDVAKDHGAGALLSGFTVAAPSVPRSVRAGTTPLRVFAVVGNRASPLPVGPAIKAAQGGGHLAGVTFR